MSTSPNDSLYISIKRWRYGFRIFGLAPFSIDGREQLLRLVCEPQDRIWPAFWMLIILPYFGAYSYNAYIDIIKRSETAILLHYLWECMKIATVAVSLIPGLLTTTPSIIQFFPEIAATDKFLMSNEENGLIWPAAICITVAEIILILSYAAVILAQVQHVFFSAVLMAIAQVMVDLIFTLEFTQFFIVALLVKDRFKVINDRMGLSLENANCFRSSDFMIQCSGLRKAYSHLYDAVELTNSYYGLPVLFGYFWCFCALVASITHGADIQQLPYWISEDIIEILLALLYLTVSSISIHMATKESLKTQFLIQKLLLVRMEKDMEKEVKQFAIQVYVMRISFNAYGFVEYGLGTFYTILALACSYILVFVQFGQMKDV